MKTFLFIQLIFTERLADSKSISQGNGGYSNEQDRFTVPTLTVLRFWRKNKIKESYKYHLLRTKVHTAKRELSRTLKTCNNGDLFLS